MAIFLSSSRAAFEYGRRRHIMSEMSSSEKPEFCWPNRRGSTTVCVAAHACFSQKTTHKQFLVQCKRDGRTLSRLRKIPAGIHWENRRRNASRSPSLGESDVHYTVVELRDGVGPAGLPAGSERCEQARARSLIGPRVMWSGSWRRLACQAEEKK